MVQFVFLDSQKKQSINFSMKNLEKFVFKENIKCKKLVSIDKTVCDETNLFFV